MSIVETLTAYNNIAAATASGDAERIAAAQATRIRRLDRTSSTRTIASFDFRSSYVHKAGETIAAGKTFRNLVSGGADAVVSNTSGLSYHRNAENVIDGIRFTGVNGSVLLPAAAKLPSTTSDFGFRIWFRLHSALSGTNYRTLGGWADLSVAHAYSFQIRTTSILGLVDGSADRVLISAPQLETVYQIQIRYKRGAGNVVTEPLYRNGAQIGTGTGYTDSSGALNQPSVGAFIGQLPNFYNAGMDFTIHRVVLEDYSTQSDRPNPDGLDLGYVDVRDEWAAYQNRFL